jgi:hypothetical protein
VLGWTFLFGFIACHSGMSNQSVGNDTPKAHG